MLNVYAGDGNGVLEYRTSLLFSGHMEDEWFEDDFVKDLVRVIDKSEVIGPHLIESPVLGPISPSDLSGGVKCLIMMYKIPKIPQRGTAMGDNCLNSMIEIGRKVDCTVHFNNVPDFDEITVDVSAYFPQIEKQAHSKKEFKSYLLEAGRVWRLQNKDKFKKVDI